MTRVAFAVALLALACGGSPRDFDQFDQPGGEAGANSAGQFVGGSSAGGAITVGGSETQPDGGEPHAFGGTDGEPITVAGSGGTDPGSAGTGSGGQPTAGAGGQPVAGSGGQLTAGNGGTASAGMSSGGQSGSFSDGGEPSGPIECARDMLDCTAEPGCETWMLTHDNCGECGKKCGLSQICKRTGPGGDYYCQTP